MCVCPRCYTAVKHGALSWLMKTLEAFQIKCLKKILCVTWQDAVPHTEVLKWAGSGSMQSTLNNHQLRWLGHVICMLEGRHLPKVRPHEGQRSAGGQKKQMQDRIKTTEEVHDQSIQYRGPSHLPNILALSLCNGHQEYGGRMHTTSGGKACRGMLTGLFLPPPTKPSHALSAAVNP